MKLAMMFTTAALLATGVTAVFDVAFTFHTKQDGEGDEVEDIQIEPDDLNVFGDKCVKPDDEDDKIKSIKIDKAFLQKDSAVGDYCVSGYDDDDCEEDDHVFEYPYEQADVERGYWNFDKEVKYAKVVAGKCSSWENSDDDGDTLFDTATSILGGGS